MKWSKSTSLRPFLEVHYIYISTFDILFLHQNYYSEVQSEENKLHRDPSMKLSSRLLYVETWHPISPSELLRRGLKMTKVDFTVNHLSRFAYEPFLLPSHDFVSFTRPFLAVMLCFTVWSKNRERKIPLTEDKWWALFQRERREGVLQLRFAEEAELFFSQEKPCVF